MSKIFGISNLPVSTPMSPFEPVKMPVPKQSTVPPTPKRQVDHVNKKQIVSAKQYVRAVKQYFNRIIK